MIFPFLKRFVLSKKELYILEENTKWRNEHEIKMRHLIDITDEMIATFSNEGQILFANRSWKKNMMYSADEVPRLTLADILAPASMREAEKNLALLIAGKTIHNSVCTMVAKDGSFVYVEGTLVPLINDGELKSSQCFFRNINERKSAEDSKTQYIKILEEMLFNFSHKVRKPVATCMGLVEVLNAEETLSEQQLREFAGYFNISVRELDAYIHEMTNFLQEKKIMIAGLNQKE